MLTYLKKYVYCLFIYKHVKSDKSGQAPDQKMRENYFLACSVCLVLYFIA